MCCKRSFVLLLIMTGCMQLALKVTMAMSTTGCEFNSLQYATVDKRVLSEAKDLISEQALRATLDADAAVSRLQRSPEQSIIVFDSTSTNAGVHLSGAGCAVNGTVQSGSSCTVSKPGWNCSPLACEATRWGQAKCIPDGETVLTNDFPGLASSSIGLTGLTMQCLQGAALWCFRLNCLMELTSRVDLRIA